MRDFLTGVLKDTWYLLIIVVACIGLGAHLYTKEKQEPQESADLPVARIEPATVPPAIAPEQARRISVQDRARTVIEQHEERFEADADSEDAPALLHAMGNLARHKLGEYEEAAGYYEVILTRYPDWVGIAKVYPQLATCYERMGDGLAAQSVYKRMLKRFPGDSQEYQFARAQLGL